jgi:hypothetical protein
MTPIQLWGYFKTFFVGSFVLRQCKKWTCKGKHSWKIPSYGQKGTSYMYFLYRQTIVKHKLVIFQLHLRENKFHSMRCRRPLCTIPTGFFEFYSASSLKQQSAITCHPVKWHIIPIPTKQSLLVFLNAEWKATNTNFIFWFDQTSAHDASMLTITPSIQLIISCEKHPNYMWNCQDTMLKGDYCSQSYVMTNNPIKFEHIHHTVSEELHSQSVEEGRTYRDHYYAPPS